jgi:hypothetical protein
MTTRLRTGPASGRGRRRVVWLFVALILVAGAERRLAELHFNLRSAALGIESNELLDGDEIRARLVILKDEKAPTLLDVTRAVASRAVLAVPPRREPPTLGRPAPRGPPGATSSRA